MNFKILSIAQGHLRTGRERERERQTDRQTETERDTERETETEREREMSMVFPCVQTRLHETASV